MKKLVLLAVLIMTTVSLKAQTELTSYGWEQWGIYTLVPVGANINENTENTFEVENDEFLIRLEIWDVNDGTVDDLADLLLAGADEAGITNLSKISHFNANGNSIAYVTGRDSVNNAILFGLIFGGSEDTFVQYTVVCESSNWNLAVKMISSVEMP